MSSEQKQAYDEKKEDSTASGDTSADENQPKQTEGVAGDAAEEGESSSGAEGEGENLKESEGADAPDKD